MSQVSNVLNAISHVYIGTEMVTEVASDLLLHFLVSTTVAAVTTATICTLFTPIVSVASAMLVYAPLVSVTSPVLVIVVGRWTIFMWVCLVVSVWPLIEVGTSLFLTPVDSRLLVLTLTSLGAMGMTAVTGSYERSRCVSPQLVLIDLDHGSLQIGHDSIQHHGLGELCDLDHRDSNVGAWSLVDLLVATHVESIG
jgi:hypothetical protein